MRGKDKMKRTVELETKDRKGKGTEQNRTERRKENAARCTLHAEAAVHAARRCKFVDVVDDRDERRRGLQAVIWPFQGQTSRQPRDDSK